MLEKYTISGSSGATKTRDRSIARNLAISLFLLVIIAGGIFLAVLYSKQSQLLLQELENEADDYANYLGEILAVPIWDYDDEQIEKIGTGFAKNELVDELFNLFLGQGDGANTGQENLAGYFQHRVVPVFRQDIFSHFNFLSHSKLS